MSTPADDRDRTSEVPVVWHGFFDFDASADLDPATLPPPGNAIPCVTFHPPVEFDCSADQAASGQGNGTSGGAGDLADSDPDHSGPP
jgi:hypothetical protein